MQFAAPHVATPQLAFPAGVPFAHVQAVMKAAPHAEADAYAGGATKPATMGNAIIEPTAVFLMTSRRDIPANRPSGSGATSSSFSL